MVSFAQLIYVIHIKQLECMKNKPEFNYRFNNRSHCAWQAISSLNAVIMLS